jgi:heme exporter protein D
LGAAFFGWGGWAASVPLAFPLCVYNLALGINHVLVLARTHRIEIQREKATNTRIKKDMVSIIRVFVAKIILCVLAL